MTDIAPPTRRYDYERDGRVIYRESFATIRREVTLDHLPEEEAEAQLVALPGVGPWTAHMFLMFVLHHPDVVAIERGPWRDT